MLMYPRKLISVPACVLAASLSLVAVYMAAPKGLSSKEAQALIRRMAGIELPSSAVRIKDISATGSSAVVVAEVETAFRFDKNAEGKWRVAEVRTGDRRWENIELLETALNREKNARARAELENVATALESFRRERGFYVAAKDFAPLLDQLNPRYLKALVRFDPWHRPYKYEGTTALYTLRSDGPDGKPDTTDDLVVSSKS